VGLSRQQRRAKARAAAKKAQKQQSKPPAQTHNQPPPQEQRPRSIGERIQNHPVVAVLTLIATLIALGAPLWQTLRGPALSLSDVDTTSPFAAPIVATNESWPFYMRHAHVNCGVENVKWEGGGGIENLSVDFANREQTLRPNKPAIFQCTIVNLNRVKLLSADIMVSVSYQMFGFWNRRSDEMEITWFTSANPPRWIVGHLPEPYM
jgi:hypothetical protein